MKKYSGWKKTAAFAMSMALVTGALPVNAGGLFNAKSAIVANAASEEAETEAPVTEAKSPAVGTLFKVGDTIAIAGETWFVVDDDINSGAAKAKVEDNLTITGYDFSEEYNQHVWLTGDVELYPLHNGFYVTSGEDTTEPEGFYITSGKGTENDPYIIGLKAPKFSGRNVSLSDDIGLNFIVNTVDDSNAADLKVKLSGDCEETGFQSLNRKTINGQEVYCVTANVTANKMDSKITAELYFGESTQMLDSYTFSVNDYLDEVDTSENPKLAALVRATKQYGLVSASYFGNGELPEVADHSDEILNTSYQFGDYIMYKYKPAFESSDARISLVLNSKLALRLYTAKYEQSGHPIAAYDMFSYDENNKLTITTPTEINIFEGAKGKYCFEIPNITPTQLGNTFNVNYQGTDYLFTPLAWAYRVLDKENAPLKDVAMANSLYEYYIAATDYVGYGKEQN